MISSLLRLALFSLSYMLPLTAVAMCADVRLTTPVNWTEQDLEWFRSLPPLRVEAVNAPPMALYDPKSQTYDGIATDVLCFIANELGIRYVIDPDREQTVAERIRQVQSGQADMFLSLSQTPARAEKGLFTLPYYDSYYAIIARKGRRMHIQSLADLVQYRVGVVKGVALEAILREQVPGIDLVAYDLIDSAGLFRALRNGEIDLIVFNQDIFTEKRYQLEYFDLEIVQTLRDYPRSYRFYWSLSPQHQRLVDAFDRYLAAMDVSASVFVHADSEQKFLDHYVAQRSQRMLLLVASGLAVLLALIFYLILRRYRRLTCLLAQRNQHIVEQQQALQLAYQKLEKQSQTDGLTGLSNRHHFDHILLDAYRRQQHIGSALSLLIIDVDFFKRVNDHYGHLLGDDYLRAIAGALAQCVNRTNDLAARFGGEEFACILPDTEAAMARQVADAIMQAVADLNLPNPLADTPRLTISIGIATMTDRQISLPDLIDQADAQLYAAKQAGRNQICAISL